MRNYLVRKTILIVLGFVAAFVFTMFAAFHVALAQDAANYHAEYNVTNLYGGDQNLIYHFTGLDPLEDYVWLLQGTDEQGEGNEALAMRFFGDGVSTTHTITFGADAFTAQTGTPYNGSARLIDNFGNELGRHYVLPGCYNDAIIWCDGVDWANAGGVNAIYQRFGVGDHFTSIPRNVDGYFHPYNDHKAVLTRQGDYTFLHFQFDLAILPTTDEYRFYDMKSGDLLYQFALQDLYDYNDDDGRVTLGNSTQAQSFIVLSTDGITPDFINHAENASAFATRDNPHSASFDFGAYDYRRTTSVGVYVDDGESVFLVGHDKGREWMIRNNQEQIGESGQLRLEVESVTEEIWDAAYIDHNLSDSVEGVQDVANYAFQRRRNTVYTVAGIAQSAIATWTITPNIHNAVVATLAHRRFYEEFAYTISNVVAVADRVEEVLNGFGMDTPLGRGLGMLVIMGVAILFVAKQGARGIIPFGMIYLAIGGAWLALGLGDTITTMLFGISAVVMIFLMVNSRKSEGGLEG